MQVSEIKLFLKSLSNPTDSPRHLSRDECLTAPRALMVEQNSVTNEQIVGLTVIHRKPMPSRFAHAVRTARMEWSLFILGRRRCSEHLGRPRLIITNRAPSMDDVVAQCLYHTQS